VVLHTISADVVCKYTLQIAKHVHKITAFWRIFQLFCAFTRLAWSEPK